MSLKELLGDPPARDNGKKSWIQTMQEELSADDYQALIDALKDKRYSAAYLSRKLSSAGHTVSRTTIAINRQRLLDE